MTKLEAALLEATGLEARIVAGMTLVCRPQELPVLHVEVVLTPNIQDVLPDHAIKRFQLVEIPEEEPDA